MRLDIKLLIWNHCWNQNFCRTFLLDLFILRNSLCFFLCNYNAFLFTILFISHYLRFLKNSVRNLKLTQLFRLNLLSFINLLMHQLYEQSINEIFLILILRNFPHLIQKKGKSIFYCIFSAPFNAFGNLRPLFNAI